MSGVKDFRIALRRLIVEAESEGHGAVTVVARELHDVVNGKSAAKNEMPTCCQVMWEEFAGSCDSIIYAPPSGKGGRLSLRYTLPREQGGTRGIPSTQAVRTTTPQNRQNRRTVLPPDGAESLFAAAKALVKDHRRVADASTIFQDAKGDSLRSTVALLQKTLVSRTADDCNVTFNGIAPRTVLEAALLVKAASAQVNEVVHAAAIILALSKVLEPTERVEALSLAAGNSGTQFDVETNLRVAEFKIIDWKGADSVREAQLFKDFFNLCESATKKRKYLYVTGLERAESVLKTNRSCIKTLKRSLADLFEQKYPHVSTFAEYYRLRGAGVMIVGLDPLLVEFTQSMAAAAGSGE